MKQSNICMITNIGPHYRYPIFNLLGEALNTDFYIGDRLQFEIKTFDYHALTGYKKMLHNVFINKFYWQKGSLRPLFGHYKYFILDGEPFCLSSWVIILLARLMGKKTIAWTHGWYGREGAVKSVVKKLFYALHSKLMVYNEYSINLMEQEGIDRNKMVCIANSLDSDKDMEIRRQLGPTDIYSKHFNNSDPTIIYCGRLQKIKKLDMLIDALVELKAEGINANIIFVGKDTEQVDVDRYALQRGVSQQIWMYGPCYDDTVLGQLFYDAAICVSPGHVGLTAIHALSFGCPVITHDNFAYQAPEFEAIKPGITGDFFHHNDTHDLVRVLKKWLGQNDCQRNQTRSAAFDEIDSKWNIHYQLDIIRKITND